MAHLQRFGGDWTEKKLDCLRKYLAAYLKVFKNQGWCTTLYIDAFAGTGYREVREAPAESEGRLFEDEFGIVAGEEGTEEMTPYMEGSASIALDLNPGFKEYHFIEKDKGKHDELEKLRLEYPGKAGHVYCYNDEANAFLKEYCSRPDSYWKARRAVLFLDPFGMSVEWPTLEAIARTGKIDTWILVPLATGVMRLLERSGNISEGRCRRLNSMFGTDEWRSAFYAERKRKTLFGDDFGTEKIAPPQAIGDFFIKRLATIFPKYAPEPLMLYNSKNNPIFMFCFAAANPGPGGDLAVKIAKKIIGG